MIYGFIRLSSSRLFRNVDICRHDGKVSLIGKIGKSLRTPVKLMVAGRHGIKAHPVKKVAISPPAETVKIQRTLKNITCMHEKQIIMIVAKFLHACRKARKPAGFGADGGIVQVKFQRHRIKMAMRVIDMGKRERMTAPQARAAGTGNQAQGGKQ